MNADASNRSIRIATRGSKLARRQAETVRDQLLARRADLRVELVFVSSVGDADQTTPLDQLGGVGLFTKEIQEALLDGRADAAVHSLKDLPTEPHDHLRLTAVLSRERAEDVLLSPRWKTLDGLPNGATVATGSLRRRAQLARLRPDLKIVPIRGNVDTRIRKLNDEGYDGLILAFAGLRRLNLESAVTQALPIDVMIPAPAQGAIGVECRSDDHYTIKAVAELDDRSTRAAVTAERALLAELEGGCKVPIGAFAIVESNTLKLTAGVFTLDGGEAVIDSANGNAADAESIGRALARRMIEAGARKLIED